MKKIIFILFLFASTLANSQSFTISGKINDENNQPLASASVFIKNTNNGTSADFEGNYQLKVATGTYKVEVRFIGYKSASKTVTITNKNAVVNFNLQPENNLLDEVLVAAVRVKADAPVTHSNLTKKEIAKRNLGQDIPMLMNYLPNVISSSDAGAGIGYTYIRVRGSDASRVNVTLNGIPFNDSESQGTFWVNMGDFASSTQSLQLQRGVGTSTNGSGAFGASLNILTDAISENPYAEISNSFGSYNTRKHTVKFSTGKINDHLEFSGRMSKIYSDGYIDRAFTDLKSYFLQGSYTDENTLVKAIVFGGKERTYQAWEGIDAAQLKADRTHNPYTYENETDNYWQDHYQLHWNEKLNENWSTNIALNYTRGKGYYEQYKAGRDAIDYNNLIADGSDVVVQRWLDNHFYVFNFNANYKKDGLEIISGISYSDYKNDHYGEIIWGNNLAANTSIFDRYYESNSTKSDFSLFSKATYNLSDNFKAFIDLQGRFVNYTTAGLTSDRDPINVDKDFSFFNPKVGLTYKMNDNNSFYASYARANKEPNRNDFEGGISQHESLDDFELGWRLASNRIKLNTNVYFMNYQNQLVLTGAIDGNTGEPLRASSGKSYRFGLEIDANITISNQFSMLPNISLSRNRNKDFNAEINGQLENLGETPITFSPDVVFGNSFVYKPKENLQIAFLSKYVGKQFMSNLNSKVSKLDVLEGFFTSDLNVVYEIETSSVFESITFTGLINNIFNKEYVDRGYYYTYDDTWSNPGTTTTVDGSGYYPQATRNFLVGVTFKF